MPTRRTTVLYDVNDFKINTMIKDDTTAPTYGTPTVDVPGIASVSMDPNINSNELKGDAMVIAKKGNIDRFNFSAQYGRIALDAQAIMLGGQVTDVTTPSSVKWTIGGTNSLPYFKAQFQILQAEVADVHLTAWKSQITGGSLIDQSTDSFGQPSVDFEAIPCSSDQNKFVDIEFFDAVTALA